MSSPRRSPTDADGGSQQPLRQRPPREITRREAADHDDDVTSLFRRPLRAVAPRSLTEDDVTTHDDDSDRAPASSGRSPLTSDLPSEPQCQPRAVGGYQMFEEIGHGGMASVHLGCTTGEGPRRVVAIKQVAAALTWRSGAMPMLLDEALLLARIRHPNVVPVLDMVVEPKRGELYMVLEYVHGATLAHLLGWGRKEYLPPPPRIAAAIMVGILRGLHAAHQATTDDGKPLGIVHCDVSPQNIMVGSDGLPRIIDFGIARSALTDVSRPDAPEAPGLVTRPLGKRSYMSPEQLRGHPPDRRTDIYSAAVVLWELLAGRRLFRGADRSAAWSVGPRPPTIPPSAYHEGGPPHLDEVVLRALDPQRENRFATAQEFADHLLQVTDVASPMEIQAWVQQASGPALVRQSERVAQVLGSGGSTVPVRWRWPLAPRLTGVSAWRLGAAVMVIALGLVLRWSGNAQGNAVGNSAVNPPRNVAIGARLIRTPGQSDGRTAEGPSAASPPSTESPTPPRTVSAVTVAVRAIEELNRKAARAYRQHDFSGARRLLYTALALCTARRLDLHRQAAVAHAQLGAVLVRGFRQRELAIERFRIALRIDHRVPAPFLDDAEVRAAFRTAADWP